jgi:hypothetical protein
VITAFFNEATAVPDRSPHAIEEIRGWWRAAGSSSVSSWAAAISGVTRNAVVIVAMAAVAVAVAMGAWTLTSQRAIAPSTEEKRSTLDVDALQRRAQQVVDRAEAMERAARQMEAQLKEERRAREAAERAAKESQAQLSLARSAEKVVAHPARPVSAPTSQLLSLEDLRRVTALAEKKQLRLPPAIQMRAPASDVPEHMRRFVGIWVSDSGVEKTGRQYMLIVTNVFSTGQATGFHIVGPLHRADADPARAAYYPFVARIADNVLSIEKPNVDIVGVLSSRNEFDITESSKSGPPVGQVALKLVWRLVDAERTTKQ